MRDSKITSRPAPEFPDGRNAAAARVPDGSRSAGTAPDDLLISEGEFGASDRVRTGDIQNHNLEICLQALDLVI